MSDQPPPPCPPLPPSGDGYAARAPKPGVVPLAPMGLGEVFGALFATIGRHWQVLLVVGVGAAAVGTAASIPAYAQMTSLLDIRPETDPDVVVQQLVAGLMWLPLAIAVSSGLGWVATAFVTPVVHAAVLGQPITLGQVWQRVRAQAARLLALAVVASLAVTAGTLLCIVPGVVLGVLWGFAAPALVVERCSVGTALRRSWRLVSSQFWRVAGIVVLVWLAVGFVSGVVGQVASLGASVELNTDAASGLGLVALAVSSLLTTSVTVPVVAMTWTLLYLDARIRTERYDVALVQAARGTSTGRGHPLG